MCRCQKLRITCVKGIYVSLRAIGVNSNVISETRNVAVPWLSFVHGLKSRKICGGENRDVHHEGLYAKVEKLDSLMTLATNCGLHDASVNGLLISVVCERRL